MAALITNVPSNRVVFTSGGDDCVGYLFQPATSGAPVPCVVLGHGFTGTQDRLLGSAERFAAEGMAALTFDYRNFGESGGDPRQLIRIEDQLEDFRNAIAFARRQPGIDPERIGLWGSSLGGGHVIILAAEDDRIAAVVAQVPFNGVPKQVEGRSPGTTLKVLAAMARDTIRGWLGRSPAYIKAVGEQGEVAVMASAEAQKTIDAMDSEKWENRVAPRVLWEMMRYKPGKVAARITAPVLVCIAEFDKETLAETQVALAAGPQATLKRYPIEHFDIYRPDVRERVISDQAAFFAKALLG